MSQLRGLDSNSEPRRPVVEPYFLAARSRSLLEPDRKPNPEEKEKGKRKRRTLFIADLATCQGVVSDQRGKSGDERGFGSFTKRNP